MIQKRSLMGGPSQLPPTPQKKLDKIETQVILNKNEFEHRGNHTVKGRPYDAAYKDASFSVN